MRCRAVAPIPRFHGLQSSFFPSPPMLSYPSILLFLPISADIVFPFAPSVPHDRRLLKRLRSAGRFVTRLEGPTGWFPGPIRRAAMHGALANALWKQASPRQWGGLRARHFDSPGPGGRTRHTAESAPTAAQRHVGAIVRTERPRFRSGPARSQVGPVCPDRCTDLRLSVAVRLTLPEILPAWAGALGGPSRPD